MGRVGTNLVALDPRDDAGFEEYPKLEDFRVTAIPNTSYFGGHGTSVNRGGNKQRNTLIF